MKKKNVPRKKLYQNLRDTIQEYIFGKNYSPIDKNQLISTLKITKKYIHIVYKILDDLLSEGIIIRSPIGYMPTELQQKTIIGVISVHHKGFGFVQPENAPSGSKDIFIPKHSMKGAIDGDKVQVEISPFESPKGPEGKIIKIIERKRETLVATLSAKIGKSFIAFSPILGPSKQILVQTPKKKNLQVGDRVLLKVEHWQEKNQMIQAHIVEIYGSIEDPKIDVDIAVLENGLEETFSELALKNIPTQITKKDLEERKDFTQLECVTIDPKTAKDFDDAISLTQDKKKHYHLGVHIADAAYFVQAATALDQEAFIRANSTYFPEKCIPMLPEILSNGLCSLKPDVIRLTVSVMMEYDAKGKLVHYSIHRAYIQSKKRFTYEEAFDILENKKKNTYAPLLKRMKSLCLLLKEKRKNRGSIDFALPEARILVHEDGSPEKIEVIQYDVTHQMIEEFMLKANEIVAKHLSDQGKDLIFRVHEEPSVENFQDFFRLAANLGFDLPKHPDFKDIQNLFDAAKKTPHFEMLSISFIRSMKLAMYSPKNIGHYGLSLEYYAHFTSPIRRYSDLVIQRLLFDECGEKVNLDKIAKHCSEKERISFKAESSVIHLKKLRLIKKIFKANPKTPFSAFITKIKPYGIHFELSDFFLEGSLHLSDMDEDYFIYDDERLVLEGRHTHKQYHYGKKIQVRLIKIDLIHLETRWQLLN